MKDEKTAEGKQQGKYGKQITDRLKPIAKS
jgi:hypothetical protein